MNPLSLVYDALFAMAAQHADIASLVKPRNLVTLETTDYDPVKLHVGENDKPEILLSMDGMNLNLFSASNATELIKSFQWLVSTGDYNTPKFHQIEWALICAMAGWQTKLTSLVWPPNSGRSFVTKCGVNNVREGWSDPDRNRGIKGWSAVWSCEVQMHFATIDLLNNGS
jgi:hypothetical protein